jgi:tRNA dimethylallyltransferase
MFFIGEATEVAESPPLVFSYRSRFRLGLGSRRRLDAGGSEATGMPSRFLPRDRTAFRRSAAPASGRRRLPRAARARASTVFLQLFQGHASLDTADSNSDDARVHPPVFLLGATGVGKSAVALELARRRGAAILALDALQVYRAADIGVSKPTAAERTEFPHGGLDLAEFGAAFDVARYAEHARAFLAEQAAAGRPVIVVGGTGLYFRALTRGLCAAPPMPADLRDELAALPLDRLRARLERVDAPMLQQVDANNPRRLIRAIAVAETTGRSLAAWQAETTEPVVRDFRAFWLQRPRAELDARIEVRARAMLAGGWIGEVRRLIARHGAAAVEAFPGIGYREIAQALGAAGGNAARDGESDACADSGATQVKADEPPLAARSRAALERAIFVATRRYAKRQLTWFRRELTLEQVILSGAAPVPPALLSP